MRRTLPWILVVLLAAGYGYARSAGPSPAENQPARVVRVVDGDTILVATAGGAQERVRYIGMDTPETVKPRTPVQCYGKKASAANKRLVAGQAVRLVSDAERRDRYGRLLAYVYRASDGLFVNAELVRDGYARPLTIAPNARHAREFAALAAAARRAGRGLWSACGR
ncbi:MAG: micrococcal nuclease [Baekduia sp.]|nr:micrococcal nuclease [Baekduia sp.]